MKDSFKNRFKNHFLLTLFAYTGKLLVRLLTMTCRFEIYGLDLLHQAVLEKKCILMIWHNRLILVAEILRKFAPKYIYAALISSSRDGELLAILARSYKFGRTIRVPHHARHQALRKMIHQLKHGEEIIIVTPDGPRGPRYEVKPGIAVAAKKFPTYIIPFTWISTRFWQFGTWDKLILPKPFSKIIVTFGKPVSLSENLETNLDDDSQFLKHSLQDLEHAACHAITPDQSVWPK
jgi:lysophospholipid acyltransferase (LPLAT)-like uncharacterized protein